MEEQEIAIVRAVFNGSKKFFNETEIALAYKAWNTFITGSGHPPKVDTKCATCRRGVITGVIRWVKEGKI